MRRLLLAVSSILLASAGFAQTEGDYAHSMRDVAVLLSGGTVTSSGGGITGGTCTNQVLTSIDASGVPTCSNISSAMIPATTIAFSDIQDATALSLFGVAANSAGMKDFIAASAASDCAYRESGSTLGCGTIHTAGFRSVGVTLAKIANASANRVLLGSGPSGSGSAYAQKTAGNSLTVYADDAGVTRFGFDPRTQWFMYDDFLFDPATTASPGGAMAWTVTTSGTPANFGTTITDGDNHPGQFQFSGSGTNNATHLVRSDILQHRLVGGEVIECMVYFHSVSAGKFGCGFGDTTTDPTTGTDGTFLFFDSATSTHWRIRNRKAAGGLAFDSNSTVVVNTWYRLTIVVNAAASSVAYYVNGVELSASPLASDIPSTSTTQFGVITGIIQAGAIGANPIVTIDYIQAYGPIAR